MTVAASGQPARVAKTRARCCQAHRIASLAKRWLLGTHQGAVDAAHLPSYLNEFVFRFNRRRSLSRGMLFYRVLELAVAHDPVRYQDLARTKRPKAKCPTGILQAWSALGRTGRGGSTTPVKWIPPKADYSAIGIFAALRPSLVSLAGTTAQCNHLELKRKWRALDTTGFHGRTKSKQQKNKAPRRRPECITICAFNVTPTRSSRAACPKRRTRPDSGHALR